jgi:hypothetical protein
MNRFAAEAIAVRAISRRENTVVIVRDTRAAREAIEVFMRLENVASMLTPRVSRLSIETPGTRIDFMPVPGAAERLRGRRYDYAYLDSAVQVTGEITETLRHIAWPGEKIEIVWA